MVLFVLYVELLGRWVDIEYLCQKEYYGPDIIAYGMVKVYLYYPDIARGRSSMAASSCTLAIPLGSGALPGGCGGVRDGGGCERLCSAGLR